MMPRLVVAPKLRASIFDNRPIHAALGLAYLLAYWNVYITYVSVRWSYAGFAYRPLSLWELSFAAVGVTAVAFFLPTRLRSPSALFVWLLFSFVYVPTMAQTFMLGERVSGAYVLALVALTAVMILACLACGRRSPSLGRLRVSSGTEVIPRAELAYGFLLVAAVMSVLLLFYYRSILAFADITNSDDIYSARFAAADMTGVLIGYIRLYYGYVFGPAVLAFGLISQRYRWFIAPGLACFVVSYMIDGSKISLVTPLAIFAIYAVVRVARASLLVMTGAMGAVTLVCSLLTGYSSLLRLFADLILIRSIAIPGQQFVLYYDLFASRGYTWWSNVRGISLFVPPPAGFAADPRWPVLGQIVGEEYSGVASQNNSNASLFAGEGVAAAGPLGVLVIGVLLVVYLRILDRSSADWHRIFVLMVMVPVALALTNIHLSTMLLSSGGAFWVALFIFLRRFGVMVPARPR